MKKNELCHKWTVLRRAQTLLKLEVKLALNIYKIRKATRSAV